MFKLISILLIFFIADVCYSQVRVTVDEKQNVLIVRAPKEQQIQIKKIIESIDLSDQSNIVKVVPMNYIYSSDIVPALTTVMRAFKPSMRSSISSNTFDPSVSGIILSDDRTNQLIIISDKSTITHIESIAKQLDKKIKLEDNILFKQLKNAKPSDIGVILNNISKR
jgi:type II secretory pathway component GspD/PulD (secretin)